MVFTRMLDNVVEINGLPLGKQREEIARKRRHGMGFLGLGSTLTMLGMKYGSRESVEFTERVGAKQAYLVHMAHEVDHQAVNAELPEKVRLAYDGLVVEN